MTYERILLIITKHILNLIYNIGFLQKYIFCTYIKIYFDYFKGKFSTFRKKLKKLIMIFFVKNNLFLNL
jgi:hypothetical protein